MMPFGMICIINCILFIFTLASLICRSFVLSFNRNAAAQLKRQNEYICITLGLSLLYGVGWPVGLLASSGIPNAVRYTADWVFTLITAFNGVYLFVLFVLRSPDARKAWKHLLVASFQPMKKPFIHPSTSISCWERLRDLLYAVRSRCKRLKTNILNRPYEDNNANRSTLPRNPNPTSTNTNLVSSAAGKLTGMSSPHDETLNELKSTTPTAKSTHLRQVEIELVQKTEMDSSDVEFNHKEGNPTPVSPLEVTVIIEAETEEHGECCTVESKQAEGSDTK